jgi:hypothetical protein
MFPSLNSGDIFDFASLADWYSTHPFPPTSLLIFLSTKKTGRLTGENRVDGTKASRDSDFDFGIPDFATSSTLNVTLLHRHHPPT